MNEVREPLGNQTDLATHVESDLVSYRAACGSAASSEILITK